MKKQNQIISHSGNSKNRSSASRLAIAGLLCAVAVTGSMFSFPVFGSRCAPVQHMVNILCAVLLGPFYGTAVAFTASLLRNMLGLGSLMAFPGSMLGALLCGLVYSKARSLVPTLFAEVAGTGILGGLAGPVIWWLTTLVVWRMTGHLWCDRERARQIVDDE